MSADDNKALARRYMAEGVDKGNLKIADEIFAQNFAFHFPGAPPMKRDGWAEMTKAFHAGFPDQKTTVDDLVAEGDKVAARFTFRGTHKGVFQGIAATGKKVTAGGMAIWRITGGKIAEHWVQFDGLSLMQQLGVVPPPR